VFPFFVEGGRKGLPESVFFVGGTKSRGLGINNQRSIQALKSLTLPLKKSIEGESIILYVLARITP
jgi:hypothetical protein